MANEEVDGRDEKNTFFIWSTEVQEQHKKPAPRVQAFAEKNSESGLVHNDELALLRISTRSEIKEIDSGGEPFVTEAYEILTCPLLLIYE